MLRFFSTVRQTLLDESKLSNYIGYALGEIVLVMVGILLALQVNNWNERRVALNETKDYLTKKLNNLDEDRKQIEVLLEYRVLIKKKCKVVLDKGYENSTDFEIINLTNTVLIEQRFISAVTDIQKDGLANYFKHIEGTGIESLEQDYLNLVDVMTFSEGRLNAFSEELEGDLWRTGFFTDNRAVFTAFKSLSLEEYNAGDFPPLVRKDRHAIQSLMSILRRNEISSYRLSEQYKALIVLNENLRTTIQQFLELK